MESDSDSIRNCGSQGSYVASSPFAYASAQTELARAGPRAQPVARRLQRLLRLRVEGLQVVLDVVHHRLLPALLSVRQVPLVAEGHHALVSRAGNDLAIGLVVHERLTRVDHLLLHHGLRVLHALALLRAHQHRSLIEALLVGDLLRLVQLRRVVLALDAEVLAHLLGGTATQARDVDDLHQLRHAPPPDLRRTVTPCRR